MIKFHSHIYAVVYCRPSIGIYNLHPLARRQLANQHGIRFYHREQLGRLLLFLSRTYHRRLVSDKLEGLEKRIFEDLLFRIVALRPTNGYNETKTINYVANTVQHFNLNWKIVCFCSDYMQANDICFYILASFDIMRNKSDSS